MNKRQNTPHKTSANVIISQIYIKDKNKLLLFLSVWLHLHYFSKIHPFTLFNISSHLHVILSGKHLFCKKSSVSPKDPVPSFTEESRDWARTSESKEHDWLKHIRKYHNYDHSHRKSAEKVTWQITQIGNSAGCLTVKDE